MAIEPDAPMLDMAAKASRARAEEFVAVIHDVRGRVHDRLPGIAVSFTMSGFFVENAPPDLERIIEATDVLTADHSCVDLSTFLVQGLDAIAGRMADVVGTTDGRDVIVQEVSCHSGRAEGPSITECHSRCQADWFRTLLEVMDVTSAIRAAFVLDLVDRPKSLLGDHKAFLRAEGLDEVATRHRERLASWDLVDVNLGKKLAWAVFLERIATLASRPSSSRSSQ